MVPATYQAYFIPRTCPNSSTVYKNLQRELSSSTDEETGMENVQEFAVLLFTIILYHTLCYWQTKSLGDP